MESGQKFTDGPMDGRKFDVRCLSARRVHGSLRKVSRPHRKLMEHLSAGTVKASVVDKRFYRHTEN